MVSLFKIILEVTLLSSIMIAVILLLRLVFQSKLSIKITMFLWFLVMVRMIVPYTIQSPIQVMGFFPESTKVENQIVKPEKFDNANEIQTKTGDIAINQTQESNSVQNTQAMNVQAESQEVEISKKLMKNKLFSVSLVRLRY